MIVRQQSTGPVPPDSKLASFRESYRSREIGMGYNGWVHALIVLTGSLVSIGLALSAVQDPTFLELLAIPITLLIANIVEYFGHRGPMHEPMRGMYALFERHAKVHHQFFDEQWMSCESSRDHHIVLFPPLMLVFYLGLIALPLATIVYLTTTPNRAYLVFASSVFYYLSYELFHFTSHVHPQSRIGRLPFVARLREHHRIHHSHKLMGSHNFNITWPIGDWLFGTVYRDAVKPVETQSFPTTADVGSSPRDIENRKVA